MWGRRKVSLIILCSICFLIQSLGLFIYAQDEKDYYQQVLTKSSPLILKLKPQATIDNVVAAYSQYSVLFVKPLMPLSENRYLIKFDKTVDSLAALEDYKKHRQVEEAKIDLVFQNLGKLKENSLDVQAVEDRYFSVKLDLVDASDKDTIFERGENVKVYVYLTGKTNYPVRTVLSTSTGDLISVTKPNSQLTSVSEKYHHNEKDPMIFKVGKIDYEKHAQCKLTILVNNQVIQTYDFEVLLGIEKVGHVKVIYQQTKSYPCITGDYVVYQEQVSDTNWGIVGYHIPSKQTKILVNLPQYIPAYHLNAKDNKVIWSAYKDFTSPNWDIYLYDLNNPAAGVKQLTTDPSFQYEPAVSGNRIIWQDWRHDLYDLYLYENGKERRVTLPDQNNYVEQPDIDGTKIVWKERDCIYFHDLTTNKTVEITTNAAVDPSYPKVSGNRVVWQDNRNDNWDIYLYDFVAKKEVPLIVASGDQCCPVIHGDKVIWTDYRNGAADIYAYDLITKETLRVAVPLKESDQKSARVAENGKFVWQDFRDSGASTTTCDMYIADAYIPNS